MVADGARMGNRKGEKGRLGELTRRGLMRNDTREAGTTDEIREAGALALTLLQTLSHMFGARGLPGVGGAGETSLLEQRDVAPKGIGVVEHAASLQRHLLADRKRINFSEFAKSGVSAGSRFHPREGSLHLFQKISMGSRGHQCEEVQRKSPVGVPAARGPSWERTGIAELPLSAHSNRARRRALCRVPANRPGAVILGEKLISRREIFTIIGKGGESRAIGGPNRPKDHGERR